MSQPPFVQSPYWFAPSSSLPHDVRYNRQHPYSHHPSHGYTPYQVPQRHQTIAYPQVQPAIPPPESCNCQCSQQLQEFKERDRANSSRITALQEELAGIQEQLQFVINAMPEKVNREKKKQPKRVNEKKKKKTVKKTTVDTLKKNQEIIAELEKSVRADRAENAETAARVKFMREKVMELRAAVQARKEAQLDTSPIYPSEDTQNDVYF